MPKRTWTYHQITAAVADSIQRSIKLSIENRERGDNEVARVHHLCAIGQIQAWECITTGWQNEGDLQKLEALVDAVAFDNSEVRHG